MKNRCTPASDDDRLMLMKKKELFDWDPIFSARVVDDDVEGDASNGQLVRFPKR